MNHRHGHLAHRHHVRDGNARILKSVSYPVALPEVSVEDGTPSIAVAPPTRVLLPRASTTCGPNDNTGTCQKPTNISSVPIVLGAVIPITIAVVVLVYLHRRHRKKLRLEDLDDKHKSLDFGLDGVARNGKAKKAPNLSIDPEKSRRVKGLSMDMVNSPYLLPAGLHQSRESFHSLSRSVKDGTDPYAPVTFMKGEDPYARVKGENCSIYTKSSVGTDMTNAQLIRKQSFPSRADSFPRSGSTSPQDPVPPSIRFPERTHQPSTSPTPLRAASPPNLPAANANLNPGLGSADRDSYFDSNARDMRNSNNYLASFLDGEGGYSGADAKQLPPQPPAAVHHEPTLPSLPPLPTLPQIGLSEHIDMSSSPPRVNALPVEQRPPRLQSMEASVHHANTASMISDTSDYGDGIKVTPPSPRQSDMYEHMSHRHSIDGMHHDTQDQYATALGTQELGYDPRRLSMSIRPLPIEDPTDNPEQRANRIRSFYKEYFDDSKPDPVGHYGYEDYMEDYGAEFLAAGSAYDAHTGDFVYAPTPFAEPVTRRAMTPPPRAPPRFGSGSFGHQSTISTSTSRYMPSRGPSAMSSRSASRKPLPPPTMLTSLPTPHKLKEDSMVFNPIDFAPPATFRDRQNGRRPDSPLGTARPYSPSVRPHVPLESPFQELSPIPSPFQLRKSGTFTALDFAPPPRFKPSDVGSDAASIRSNRSGMSAMQLHSLRSGAYRVSRIPKEVVGTRDDIVTALKPKWDLVSPA